MLARLRDDIEAFGHGWRNAKQLDAEAVLTRGRTAHSCGPGHADSFANTAR
jgi:hypothetical protein